MTWDDLTRPQRLAAALFVLAVSCWLTSCRAPEWLGPVESRPWHPPAGLVAALRDSNDVCAGRPLARPTVRWFVVPGDTAFWSPGSAETLGYWTGDHRIYLADTTTTWVMRHELLHASLGKGHPPVFRACGVMP